MMRHLRCSHSTPINSTRIKNLFAPRQLSTQQAKFNEEDPELYHYTSGMWLWNEEKELAARRIQFSPSALMTVAANSIGSRTSTSLTKLAEGHFNKAFLIQMNDGQEVVAKLPNPNSGFPFWTTASEVATMDFILNVVGIPIPKVLSWNARRSFKNAVGSEYIIMEKASGEPLSRFWDQITFPERLKVVEQLVAYEKKLEEATLPAFGSLYYSNDAPANAVPVANSSYAVGPSTARDWFDEGRNLVKLDRESARAYFSHRAQRELSCIKSLARKSRWREIGIYGPPGLYHPQKSKKIHALEDYLKISEYILPNGKDLFLLAPVLWHTDLHADNIFVDPKEPTKILCIIDWQSTHIAPLFEQARVPSLLDFDGPKWNSLTPPQLPENFASLDIEEQKAVKELLKNQTLHKLYSIQAAKEGSRISRALALSSTLQSQITALAGSLLEEGEVPMQAMLVEAMRRWNDIMSIGGKGDSIAACPLSYTDEQIAEIRDDEQVWLKSVELKRKLIDALGVPSTWDGWVKNEDYSRMRPRLEQCREEWLVHYVIDLDQRKVWEDAWPFQV